MSKLLSEFTVETHMAYTALGGNITPTKVHLLMIIGVLILMASDDKVKAISAIDSLLSQVHFHIKLMFHVCFWSTRNPEPNNCTNLFRGPLQSN